MSKKIRYSLLGWWTILFIWGTLTGYSQQQWLVNTLSGNGIAGYKDGPGSLARFHNPNGICVDKAGNVYVSDMSNHRIRKISTNGTVSTYAGLGIPGYRDGPASLAQFSSPTGLAIDHDGNIYVADNQNHCVRMISTNGMVSTLAGSRYPGLFDAPAKLARFNRPIALCVDSKDNIYVLESDNNCVRKITSSGQVMLFAGNGFPGYRDGHGIEAQFNFPLGICIDKNDNIYVVDSKNRCIRKITSTGWVSTFLKPDFSGFADSANTRGFSFKNNDSFGGGVYVDNKNNLLVADGGSHLVFSIGISRKVVKLLAGNGIQGMVNGEAENAQFNNPVELTVDYNNGTVYIVDYGNNSIRKIIPKKDQEQPKTDPVKPDPKNPVKDPVVTPVKPKIVEVILQGTIKDKKTGKPIETSLLIENNQKKEVLKAYTDKGQYSADLAPGEYKIAISLDDYLPFSDLVDANLKESGTITYNIELERIEVGAKVIANNISFAQSSATLNQSSYPALFRIADFLKKHPNIKMSIEGHTDIGKEHQYNLWLSEERAKSVRDYLIQLGVKPENLTTKGWGNTKPIGDNNTAEGRKLNRRTEFVIISE